VIVNRTGTQPLSECIVTGVREGQTYSRYDSGFPGAQMDPMSHVISMTVYVDARC
jgi:succinate dehydrogenase/fumarate reductase flavoprotein subunit